MVLQALDDYMDLSDYVYDFTMYMQDIYFGIERVITALGKETYDQTVTFSLIYLCHTYKRFSRLIRRLFTMTLLTHI